MTKAEEMFEIISKAPMSSEVREKFQEYANNNDHVGMMEYFENCLKNRPEVGEAVERSGQTSFESVAEDVRAIYKR